MRNEPGKNMELIQMLKMIAPGTNLREGLDNILKAKTGALIVISDSPDVMKLADGGFKINEDYSPAKIYELAKMDGAIVLSGDAKKIILANTQLIPDSSIVTVETGTRHRSGERVAKQTKELVVSISQRRNIITLFKGNTRYVIQDSVKVLARANQAMQTLEKYKVAFDDIISVINEFEFDDVVTLQNVVTAIQRAELCMKVVSEIDSYIIELGDEGRLLELQLTELSKAVDEEEKLLIKDYLVDPLTTDSVIESISSLSRSELMDFNLIARKLGYETDKSLEDIEVPSRGFRQLTKIPKTPIGIIEKMNKTLGDFQHIIMATIEELDDVEGIGEIRAKNIKQGIKRMHEQVIYDSKFYR
ncbi:MAG: DNA integrity scanning diadenylate cyclase DisA [Clostridia bacterium]|nr:DNA integrity scanning diadenylate cyclase DisA [Clostridia bacterium]